MAKRKPLIDEDGEVRELTAANFKRMKPFSALPLAMQRKLTSLPIKVKPDGMEARTVVSLPQDIADGFVATGEDWPQRVEMVLREWLREHAEKTA